MNKIIALGVFMVALIIAALSQTDCKCDIGVYLKDVNGQCSGKIKDIQIADIPENCIEVYSSPAYVIYTSHYRIC